MLFVYLYLEIKWVHSLRRSLLSIVKEDHVFRLFATGLLLLFILYSDAEFMLSHVTLYINGYRFVCIW